MNGRRCDPQHITIVASHSPEVKEEWTIRQVIELLEYGAHVNETDSDRWAALHYCAYYGLLPLVEILLRYGADLNAMTHTYAKPMQYTCFEHRQLWFGKETALHCASARGHVETLCYPWANKPQETPDAAGRMWNHIGYQARLSLLSKMIRNCQNYADQYEAARVHIDHGMTSRVLQILKAWKCMQMSNA